MNENEVVTRKILGDVLDERFDSFKSEILRETGARHEEMMEAIAGIKEAMTQSLENRDRLETDIEPRLLKVEQKVDLIQNA